MSENVREPLHGAHMAHTWAAEGNNKRLNFAPRIQQYKVLAENSRVEFSSGKSG